MPNENHDDRPAEMPAVKTTIVGGRPPGSGKPIGKIPHGMEILIKKAAVDPEFKDLLMEKRAEAAREVELELAPAEAAMLNAVPAEQLESIIANTKVPAEARRALLGKVAGVTLAALGGATLANVLDCYPQTRILGISPDGPEPQTAGISPDYPPATDSSGCDRPEIRSQGISPDRPPAPTGIRPDQPKKEDTDDEEAEESDADQPDGAASVDVQPPPPTRGISPDRPRNSRE